jgi:hypothetical protein
VSGPTDLNGKKVLMVDGMFPACKIYSGPRHVRVFVAPNQGYLPLRMEWRCADAVGKPTTLLERVIDVLEVYAVGGAYYPKRMQCQDYLGDDVAFDKQLKEKAAGRVSADAPPPPTIPSWRTTWEITEIVPHRAIEPAELKLEFPAGTLYANAVDKRMYHAGISTPLPGPPKPPKPGAVPPALQIARWADGKVRKLSDYLGKVVVLEFSGIPGPGSEPTDSFLKGLHEKYADRGFVFLGIYPPRTDLKKVLKYHEEHRWKTPAGIDDRFGTEEGATERLYASAQGLVIIGRDGKVAFNTGAVDEEIGLILFRRAAQKLSIPWPLKEDVPKDAVDRQHMQLFDFMIKEQIDEALGKP